MKNYYKILACLLLYLATSCEQKEKDFVSKNQFNTLLKKAQEIQDPKIKETYLDSAFTELSEQDKIKNDTLKGYLYRNIILEYYNLDLYEKSLKVSWKAYKEAREERDTVNMAKILYSTGNSHYGLSNTDSAYYYYKQSEKLFIKINDLGSLGQALLYKAYIYYDYGEYVLCESEAIKALRLLVNEDKTVHIYNCYNLIATALEGQNNNREALKYFQDALIQLEKFKAEGYNDNIIGQYRASCYNNMGMVYVKMEMPEEAIKLYRQALNYTDLETENPALYAKLINNLAFAKFKAGDYSDLPDLYFKSLAIREDLNNKSGIVASKMNLGQYYVFKQDTAKAIDYLRSAQQGANEINSHFDILNSLKLLSEIDKPRSGFYSRRYIKVNDSLQEIAKANRDKFARIEYETDKLENEKEALVKKNSFIIGISAVVLLFAAAIFIIYYLNSRNKKLLLVQQQQKANEEIYQLMFEQQSRVEAARQDEKNRIAMELHDGILNNIYAARLNLEFINKKTDEESVLKRKEFIKELQKVETEIRSVSHDLSRNAVFNRDKSFKNILEFMINSQKNSFDTLFEVEIDPAVDLEAMSNVVKVNIYRIIQEALQNINKYSRADHAYVTILRDGTNMKVRITDNGVGFEPEKAKGGIGLKNLRKRATLLNGDIVINSSPGEGSSVEVLFPV